MADSTALAELIRRLIATAGPMPVGEFMELCLTHPVHGYYTTRDPLGQSGDFTTAPEISQMFGELVGLWVASVWRQMGSPENVRLVELGPGRGTMMLDMLRAAQVVSGFRSAIVAHLVEISPALERRQRENLGRIGAPTLWHKSLDEVPDGPMILVANEFFDSLPLRQAVKTDAGWHERLVAIDPEGRFKFVVSRDPLLRFADTLPAKVREATIGSIYEWRSDRIVYEIGRRVVHAGGAALIIDYGHVRSDVGDTLQAVANHEFADPFGAPGNVDLTAHVDFQMLGQAAESIGMTVHGPVPQNEFLSRLGLEARAGTLKANASGQQLADIESARRRLIDDRPDGMGRLFKAIGLAHRSLGALPGFES